MRLRCLRSSVFCLVPRQEIHHRRWTLFRFRSGASLIGISFYSFYQQGLCTYRCLRPETESKHIINHSSVPCNQLQTILLYRRWVQHNPNRCAEGLGRKIVLKLCSYYTRVACKEVRTTTLQIVILLTHTMWPGDLSPNNPNL
jgi:hypothetical protein